LGKLCAAAFRAFKTAARTRRFAFLLPREIVRRAIFASTPWRHSRQSSVVRQLRIASIKTFRMRTWIIRLWACVAVFTSVGLAPLCQASEARQTPIVKAVERAKRAVVNIYSERTARDQDIFEGGRGRKINGMGTGVIIDERGYIATNQHVVAEVDSLRVALFDGSTYAASVISYDRPHDVAIIKINSSKKLPVAPIGTSSDLMLGETVIAVGNPFGYEHTITVGVVSSLSRDVEVNEQQ
jgi:serine protease Do